MSDVDPEFEMLCAMATFTLTALSGYTDNGDEELTGEQIAHLFPVIMAYHMLIGDDEDDDSGASDYRVDDTLT
jgi:hypothetical protein